MEVWGSGVSLGKSPWGPALFQGYHDARIKYLSKELPASQPSSVTADGMVLKCVRLSLSVSWWHKNLEKLTLVGSAKLKIINS